MQIQLSEAEATQLGREANLYGQFGSHNFSRLALSPGIDIGYKGHMAGSPIAGFTGIDLDTPGYNGLNLPYADESLATVHTSHVLEHMQNPINAIREWFRVLKVGGHLIIIVPHQFLYEKRYELPSLWNADHKCFYTIASLLMQIEFALVPNHYRIVYCRDNDSGYDYSIGPANHATGRYEIELVLRRITPPTWSLQK